MARLHYPVCTSTGRAPVPYFFSLVRSPVSEVCQKTRKQPLGLITEPDSETIIWAQSTGFNNEWGML